MTTSVTSTETVHANRIAVTDDALTAELDDGRTISVPLSWYPRLVHATDEERNNWELIGRGMHIHWSDLDEDLSIEGLLAGRESGESANSFAKWLKAKRSGLPLNIHEIRRDEHGV